MSIASAGRVAHWSIVDQTSGTAMLRSLKTGDHASEIVVFDGVFFVVVVRGGNGSVVNALDDVEVKFFLE